MKAEDMTDAEIDMLLERFDQTEPTLQRRIVVQFMLNAEQMRAERDKLQKFKDYVHGRLDAAGVPTDPESPHRAEGCRIGGRLDYVLMHRSDGAVAAAVRVRKWKAGIPLKDIYPGAKTRDEEITMLSTDWRDLAMDYLNLLPAEQEVKAGGS